MKNAKKYFLLLFLIILSSSVWSYQWPMKNNAGNFDGPLRVTATFGDARGTVAVPRFHRGIDIGRTGEVYSLTSGPANTPIGYDYVRVRNYYYGHLTNRIDNGEHVIGINNGIQSPNSIGDISGDHLHFQIGPAGGPYTNPLDPDDEPDNYDDINDPTVCGSNDYWWFWKSGSEGTLQQEIHLPLVDGRIPIYGKIDIRARCQDSQSLGSTSGIYKTKWRVLDNDKKIICEPSEGIIFDQVQPPNNGDSVLLIYDRHNWTAPNSPFYYWVTNPIVNDQVDDRYWNTKLKKGEKWDGVDAILNRKAAYPAGHSSTANEQ